jgi:type III secretory pathway component EscS
MLFLYLDQWENYIQGWQLLLESGDQIFWTILIFVAWVVRATSLIAFLLQLGDRLVRHSKDIEFTIVRSLVIFLIVSVPFFLAGYPLIYPFIP